VLDKQNFPRDKVCGGWITPNVLKELEIDLQDYAVGRVCQPITGFRVGRIGGRALETDYGKPVSYGIRRCEFDDYLLKRSGARLVLGTALATLQRSGDRWIANDRIAARVVVGAGGHFCPVARLTGAKVGGEPAIVAQEAEFEMDKSQIERCRVGKEVPELYFCSDLKGYGWCFRKGNFLNVGLGRADKHRLSEHVADFLQFLKSTGRITFEVPALRGHAYLLYGTSDRKVAGDGMLLIGDAAGLAYPQSGEGILPAIESGLLAAQTIGAGNELESYGTLIARRHPTKLLSVGRYISSQLITLLARGLLQTRWFVREIVLNDWFLHPSPSRS
jgi:flavin-dependent dehydrogenase